MLRDNGVALALGAAAIFTGAGLLKRPGGRGGGSRARSSDQMSEALVEELLEGDLLPREASILYWQPVLVDADPLTVVGGDPVYMGGSDTDSYDPRPYMEGEHAVMVSPSGALHRVDKLGQMHGVASPSVEIRTEPAMERRSPRGPLAEVQILEHLQDRFGDGKRLWDTQRRPMGPAVFLDEEGQAFTLDGERFVPVSFEFIVHLG
jgi:hypothetical protein